MANLFTTEYMQEALKLDSVINFIVDPNVFKSWKYSQLMWY